MKTETRTDDSACIFALDASTDSLTLALQHRGQMFSESIQSARRHNECLLPASEALLQQCGIGWGDINAFALGCGPGSFTGTRVALVAVQGLAWSLGKQVVPLCSLRCIAGQVRQRERVAVIINSRAPRYSWRLFDCSGDYPRVCSSVEFGDAVNIPDDWQQGGWVAVGDASCEEIVGCTLAEVNPEPDPGTMLAIAQHEINTAVMPEAVCLVYSRPATAWKTH